MNSSTPVHASSERRRPRVALIGVSGYGTIYLALARAARDRHAIDLVAAVVINPEDEAATENELKSHGCAIYRDYETMLRELKGQLDLCLIPTGIQWHARMAIAALQAGANVLVEKPLAGSLAEAHQIRAAEEATGRWVAVGFQDIYCPVNQWLKAELCRGAIGPLRSVRFLGLWPRSESYFGRNHWAGRLFADGAPVRDSLLNNAFAHFVNLCLFFAGSRQEECADVEVVSADLLRAHAIETFDTSVVRARSRRGISFWIGASHTTERTLEPVLTFTGEQGTVEWRHGELCVLQNSQGRREERILPDIDVTRQTMFDQVLARLTDSTAWICGTRLAEAHTRFIEAVHEAAEPVALRREHIVRSTLAGQRNSWPVVRGLEDCLLRAHASGSTLAEAGFPIKPAAVEP